MGECEILCNRLAIMNSGKLQDIGSRLELKESFHPGFLLNAKLRPNTSAASVAIFKEAILTNFNCVLREEHGVSIQPSSISLCNYLQMLTIF